MASTTNDERFNADELVAPNWLNAQFFEELLGKYEKAPELKVVDIQMSPASGKGDHYASVMYRANVFYTTQKGKVSKSLIIKTMPEEEGHKKEMLSESHLFETEIGMYTKVLPRFEEVLRKSGDNTRLFVPCLFHSLQPRQVMVFEDLVPQGYTVLRDRGGTIEELKGAFTKLAKHHAVSFKILKETPEFLLEFKNGLYALPNILDDPFITTGMGNFIEFLEQVPELSKYAAYFKSVEHKYIKLFCKVMEEYRENRQPDGYYVLSHGDFHLRNMMFKLNQLDDSFEDCILLDYQICNTCPITVDIIYSIYMLMTPEDRVKNCDELIKFYFATFIETLQSIGYDGELPKFAEFQKQMARHRFYEIFLLPTLLPLLHGVRAKAFEVADMMQSNEVRKKLYFLDSYIEDVKHLFARFEKLGYFQ